MRTIRLMNLWKIKNKAARRAVVILTFSLFFVANIALAATGFVLFWWHNQSELFRSAAHYWRTDERITEHAPNVELTGAAQPYRAASRERSERG